MQAGWLLAMHRPHPGQVLAPGTVGQENLVVTAGQEHSAGWHVTAATKSHADQGRMVSDALTGASIWNN